MVRVRCLGHRHHPQPRLRIEMETNEIKAKLILKAIDRHGKIYPVSGVLLDGFSEYEDGWTFYYRVGNFTYEVSESEVT